MILHCTPHECKENTSGSVSKGNNKNSENCRGTPCTCHPKVKHIRNTVFRARSNKPRHAEDDGQVFSQLMRIAAVSFHRNINKDVSEESEQKQTHQAVIQLDPAECLGLLG